MAAAPKTVPTDASLVEFLQSVQPPSRQDQGCLYVRDLGDVDLDVLRRLIRRAWGEGDVS